jgi:ABC-type multidrug transport system ATPase subunit
MKNLLLSVKDLSKSYYCYNNLIKEALKNISIDIYSSEVFGLLGVNGAGKTTLSSILATLHPPTSGTVSYLGQSIYNDINSYRRIIGFCPQRPNLIEDLTVKQNLILAGYYYSLGKMQAQARADELIKKYNLIDYKDLKPEILSGGYKQRVLIARSLMHRPKILILDEPTVGLDPHVRHNLWEDIRNLRTEGVTVILTTHYLDEAEILSDRVCILDNGNIRITGTPGELMTTYQKSCLEDVFLQLMREENT